MNYGEKISGLRKSKGMTQEELGKLLNVTYQAVSKWERGESLPDFETMSQIAKIFQVSLDYFEDKPATSKTVAEAGSYLGVCTVCGKMIKEEEAETTSPKIICKECAERQKQDTERQKQEAIRSKAAAEVFAKYRREREVKAELGGGFDAALIIGLILALAGYAALLVTCFTCDKSDRFMYGAFLFAVPLAAFACTQAVFDLINELRDKDDGPDGYRLNLSLIIAGIFSAVNAVIFLVIYFVLESEGYWLVLLALGVVVSFTFISQIMWGSVLKDIFTCGGFTFKLPGFIFSLTPDSIILMLITKVILGVLSVLVFIATTIFFALVAIFGSVLTFIPCVIAKSARDKKAKSTL